MPIYRVGLYYSGAPEYEVEAKDEDEATNLVWDRAIDELDIEFVDEVLVEEDA